MIQDLTYGLRMIRRGAPLYACVVLTLIVGLGVNAVVFTIFNGLLFRAPVSRDPSSFVQIAVPAWRAARKEPWSALGTP